MYKKYKETRKKIEFITLEENPKINNNIIIAIIIPHRNRLDHLKLFIEHFNKMKLNNNKIDIYLIDQNNSDKFNRGLLLNLGYLIAKKNKSYDRFIFHDIDSFPDDTIFQLYFANLNYNIHYASPYLGYKYNFNTFFGGIIGFNKESFEKINGFPNTFFGWGGEDDALYNRVAINDIKIYRPNKGSYILPEHDPPLKQEINKNRGDKVIKDLSNYKKDGLIQLINFFINIKLYISIDDFINTYEHYTSNHSNGSENLDTFLSSDIKLLSNNNINYYIYKIDYLAKHNLQYDTFLDKSFVKNKINKNKMEMKGNFYQHKKYPEIISFIEPLVLWDEVQKKIIDTYTDLKPFNKINFTLNKEIKIENLVSKYFSIYDKDLSKNDLFNTLKFIFDRFNEILYFRIRNNKLECSYHLYSLNNKIDWLKYVKYKDNNLEQSLIDIMSINNHEYFTLRKPHYISTNNCLLGLDSYNYFEGIPTSYVQTIKEMLQYTIDKFKEVPDCDIIINRKDFSYLQKNNKYAYNHLLSETQSTIEEKIKFYFLGTQSTRSIDLDIPIPSADEWNDIDKYKDIQKIKWKDKKPIAFFRGRSTGCGSTIHNNPRLLLSDISYNWNKTSDKNNLLDASISNIVARIKVYDQIIGVRPNRELEYLKGSFVNTEDQLKYKYIFNIQGNAQAYRYPNEFKKKSLILNVKSDYKMWFEPLLVNNKHYIEIDNKFNNLYDTLIYLKDNDKEAKKIAKNGYKFSKLYINKDMIATYWYNYMVNINILTKK